MLREDELEVGEIIVDDEDCEYKILGIMEEIYVISQGDDFDSVGEVVLFKELEKKYTLMDDEEVEEMTVKEICDELGRDIKITKD